MAEKEAIQLLHKQVSYDFSQVDQIFLAEIFEFKQVIHTIFNLGTLGEKYLDLTRNEWSRNPDTDNDFDHLAVIL